MGHLFHPIDRNSATESLPKSGLTAHSERPSLSDCTRVGDLDSRTDIASAGCFSPLGPIGLGTPSIFLTLGMYLIKVALGQPNFTTDKETDDDRLG